MIGISIRSTATDSFVRVKEILGADCSGVVRPRHDAANVVRSDGIEVAVPSPPVDRTITHAMSKYEDLLRRLAD